MLSRRTIVQASLAGGTVAALAGFAAFAAWFPKPDRDEAETGWRRIGWPFPRDAFPAGRAWRRDNTEVYVRPKVGFCANCETGVVEDSEVDRVADVDLLDPNFVPVAEGKRIQITDLSRPRPPLPHKKGRPRAPRPGDRGVLQLRPDRRRRRRPARRRRRREVGAPLPRDQHRAGVAQRAARRANSPYQ